MVVNHRVATMHPTDLDLPTLVALAGGGVTRVVLDRIEADGFSGVKPSHGYVVQRLVDDEPTITALAESLGMSQQGASKQVRDLESSGYVERVVGPGDQRARRVRLTPRGRDMLASARRARAEIESEILEQVGSHHVQAAKVALVALLGVAGLDERVATRTVPTPDP
jgi:DNA-binding MarR family transcriptional regulator